MNMNIKIVMTLILICTILLFFMVLQRDKIKLNFDYETKKELNDLFSKTPKDTEFFGYLEVKNNDIIRFNLVGYKNLTSGKINIINNKIEITNYSIHSHPNGWGFLSSRDKLSKEDVLCIIYKLNCIKCWKN